MSVSVQELAAHLHQEGFTMPEEALAPLAGYLDLLMRWNKVMNLVGTRNWRDTVSKLIVDSLHLAGLLQDLPLPVAPLTWDPGAGAGLPGIPLRMVWQRGRYWMIESREKRALFLSTVLSHYPLCETQVFHGRLETFWKDKNGREGTDLLISRAFMPWNKLLPFVAPHVRSGGFVVLLLNDGSNIEPLINTLASEWELCQSISYSADSDRRVIHAVRRVDPVSSYRA